MADNAHPPEGWDLPVAQALAEPVSLMAMPPPKMAIATTAAAWTTGPVIDWTICCSGLSQGIPVPPANAGLANKRPQSVIAARRPRTSSRRMTWVQMSRRETPRHGSTQANPST